MEQSSHLWDMVFISAEKKDHVGDALVNRLVDCSQANLRTIFPAVVPVEKRAICVLAIKFCLAVHEEKPNVVFLQAATILEARQILRSGGPACGLVRARHVEICLPM